MRTGIASAFLGSLLSLGILGLPSFAHSSSLQSRTAIPTLGKLRASDYLPVMTTTTTTTTPKSTGSWNQTADQTPESAEFATERGYNRATRDVQNLTLKGRVEAVLHENKSTRGSDVHVTADNGTVTLSGQVPSETRAQTVQEVVANVYGVKTVNNELIYPKNRGAVTPPDSDSTGVAHPAYSDLAPAERAPAH